MDRRNSHRTRACIDALVCSGNEEGAGSLVDLSHSGARIEDCSLRPPVGSSAHLYLYVNDRAPVELEGVVSRHTEQGFALAYELHDATLHRLIDTLIERLSARAS